MSGISNRLCRPLARANAGLAPALLTVALMASPLLILAPPASAQEVSEQRRVRVGIGPQLFPSYPGSDSYRAGALFVFDRARGDTPFEFEAADESFDFTLVREGRLSLGPAASAQRSRKPGDLGAPMPKIGFTLELGGFAQYELSDNFRVRGELRKGLGGHDGLVGSLSADAIIRDGDDWLIAAGPRVTWSNRTYQNAYFGIAPDDAAASGLPVHRVGGGVHALGATATFVTELTPRWGIYSYARYDRVVGRPGDTPLVRQYGSRDQFSGGLALTYTFIRSGTPGRRTN